MKRDTLYKLVQFILPRIARVEFYGAEHIPTAGGVIFATNHASRFDIPLLFINPVRPDITALVADKYKRYAFMRWFTMVAEGIWIDRSKADFTAFRQSAEVLKAGRALGIAPEGTRSPDGRLLEGKAGTSLIALRAQTPIVPTAIEGSEKAAYLFQRLHRPKLVVRFGPPITLPPLPRDDREAALQRCTDEIMCQIAVLLPERYHGFYAGHPRLKELLAG